MHFHRSLVRLAFSYLLVTLFLLGGFCHADFVIYNIPGLRIPLVLEGKAKGQTANIIQFTYPGYPAIAMSRDDATIVKAPTRMEEYKKLTSWAGTSKRAEDYLEAAEFALKHGKLREFYDSCRAAYKVNPNHLVLQRLIEARKLIKRPIEGFDKAEAELREITGQASMRCVKSAHYVMLHDLKELETAPKSRIARRLELLELVYESFMLKFAFLGEVLTPPTEPMMILLFAEEKDYLRYATQLDPTLQSTSGFWSSKDNVGVFYDQGTTEEMRLLESLVNGLQRAKNQARGTMRSREVAHLANSLDLLVKIARDEADIEVVTHEATHQLAGNTGLMPRDKLGLTWAHEGLASYFETPAGAGWGGVGSVNSRRLAGYRSVANDHSRKSLHLLVSDVLFDASQDLGETNDAYGFAWALTHYLMENHPRELIDYYRRCSEITGDDEGKIARQEIVDLFEKVFGEISKVETGFHLHMKNQRSEIDRVFSALGR